MKQMSQYFEIVKYQTEQINRTVEPFICDCPDCQRYYKYMKQLPESAKAFFEESGIDPVKCQELWAYFPDDNGYTHYSGYFYIAVTDAKVSKPFNITKEWKTLDFVDCIFRVRLEYTTAGKTILGFEADLPVC